MLIPFTERFLGTAADKGLLAALKADPDAVITWMADGWRQYRETGLEPPEAVRAATRAYRDESDTLGQFLAQRCHVATSQNALRQPGVSSQVLYRAWQSWCSRNGEDPGSNKELTALLEDRGVRKKRTGEGRPKWLGVTLLNDAQTTPRKDENPWSED